MTYHYRRYPICKMLVLLELLFFVSSAASVNISLTSGELCEGAVANWTCVVNGTSLGWRNLGETAFPTSFVLVDLGSGSPFSSTLISFTGGIVTSVATANLTRSVNESSLECSDGDFDLAMTAVANVSLLLKGSSPATHISAMPIIRSPFDISIIVTWRGATCVPMYRISVMGQGGGVHDTATSDFTFTVPPDANDIYTFTVNSYNYSGQIVGSPLVASVCVSTPIVRTFPEYMDDNSTILISIEDASVCIVSDTSCSISLTDHYSYNETMSCTVGSVVEFTNITIGRQYTYNVTATNLFRSSNQIGTVVIPELPVVTTTVIKTATTTVPSSSESGDLDISILSGIIIGVVLFLLILFGLYIVLILCWISRCFCPKFWNNKFWSVIFCDCGFKGNENETKTMPFNRSESPEVVKQTVSEM